MTKPFLACVLAVTFTAIAASANAFADPEGLVGNVLYPRMAVPSTFHELPLPIMQDLERRNCRIPQPAVDTVINRVSHVHFIRANVVHGSFARMTQRDWAVICAVRHSTSMIVYWAGSARDPSVLRAHPGDCIFLRRLPAWSHDGILIGPYESEGVFLYFSSGKWVTR